jgi:hypothetical protein
MTERFDFRVLPVHQGLVINDYDVHEVGVNVCGVQHVLQLLDLITLTKISERYNNNKIIIIIIILYATVSERDDMIIRKSLAIQIFQYACFSC